MSLINFTCNQMQLINKIYNKIIQESRENRKYREDRKEATRASAYKNIKNIQARGRSQNKHAT